ncbi:hypothetical protein GGQ80_001923 [Sphingomonas jinjuensis]|uniref:Phytanoyl-CoA dioxygenase n=1 Tax=Sphingomonas jinjuensis TaxID=535907 RepID=A0A840F3V5_9SPHN|nr:phytanoyl-CoA dioxygenase family protein [Sphingomonas jinjuensis]MBB4154013.1 hypothetical protein [Sphingomonas jinjuensis]
MKAEIARAGFARCPETLGRPALAELAALFGDLRADRPGSRIDPVMEERTQAIAMATRYASALLGDGARPVRALLLDKSVGANWSLGWHQDRVIEVAAKVDVPGFGPYTVKQGRLHVAPPIEWVERLLTVRIHLDPVDSDNGPLVVAPGSHRLGFVAEREIDAVVTRCGEAICLADAGTMWFYATPILHCSARSTGDRHRRVLQLDFAVGDLPGGLVWALDVTTA